MNQDIIKHQAKLMSGIMDRAAQILGGREAARCWVCKSLSSLGGKTPVDVVIECGEIEKIYATLDRIENGISSD